MRLRARLRTQSPHLALDLAPNPRLDSTPSAIRIQTTHSSFLRPGCSASQPEDPCIFPRTRAGRSASDKSSQFLLTSVGSELQSDEHGRRERRGNGLPRHRSSRHQSGKDGRLNTKDEVRLQAFLSATRSPKRRQSTTSSRSMGRLSLRCTMYQVGSYGGWRAAHVREAFMPRGGTALMAAGALYLPACTSCASVRAKWSILDV